MSVDGTVGEINLTVGLLLEGKSVLHPVGVVSLRVIFTGVGTTRFFAVGGSNGGLGTV